MQAKGLGYNGDKGTTSTANQELLKVINAQWTYSKGRFYEFSFMNTQACSVKINGGSAIPLLAEQGVSSNENDALIDSFVVVETGIEFNWFGKYIS
jgi:hypothetical protein